MNGFLDMRKSIDLTLKDDLIPSFKTFKIACSYATKVNLTLECTGKTFLIYGSYNPCTLLATKLDPEIPRYTQPAAPPFSMEEIDDPPTPVKSVEQIITPSESVHAGQRRRRNSRYHGGFQNMNQLAVAELPLAVVEDAVE